MPLTKLGKEVAALSEDVLARVKRLQEAPPLLTYRVQMRCTLRSRPSKAAATITRWGPALPDGKPRLVTGRPALAGWIEVVEDSVTLGYIKAGALRALP